ncbi:MAG: polysaccharide deacetylase family protein [Bacilli bacterium]
MSFLFVLMVIFLILVLVYGPIAELIMDLFQVGGVYKGDDLARDITLTFDDGPHPLYTPQLLELLDGRQAQAMFFVVGQQAEKYPELVRAIHERGHVLGIHTYRHGNAWFQTPWSLHRDIVRTKDILENITHTPVTLFRPPWGRLTLGSLAIAHRVGLVPVLWTLAAKDWQPGNGRVTEIVANIGARLQNGAIILLHDNGGSRNTPANTLTALQILLPRIKDIGLSCNVNPVLHALKQRASRRKKLPRVMQRLVHPVWIQWERLFDRIYGVYPLSRLFRLSVAPWRFGVRRVELLNLSTPARASRTEAKQARPSPTETAKTPRAKASEFVAAAGEPTRTPDANSHPDSGLRHAVISPNDPMVELHLQNRALQQLLELDSPEKMAIRVLKEVRISLHHVALALVYDDRFRSARGVFGMTLMHRGIEKLGFHTEEIEQNALNRWIGLLLVWLMVLYHPQGYKRLKTGLGEMRPKLVWMTREELVARYLKGAPPEALPTLAEQAQQTRSNQLSPPADAARQTESRRRT